MESSRLTNSVDPHSKMMRLDQNGVVQPLLTDLYQITMAYAYWKSGKKNQLATFDLFFRKNPFQGEFTIFAGLEECLKFLKHFHFSDCDIEYLRTILPKHADDGFFTYLRNLNANEMIVYAVSEGTVVFPKVPIMRFEGPLPLVQIIETTMLNLVNYASLAATNAARFRLAAGNNIKLLEFGLRRAQGPDGGLSASRYCYLGGFDGTSNVLAGKLYDIPVRGTHAHAFVTSYIGLPNLDVKMIKSPDGEKEVDFVQLCVKFLEEIAPVVGILKEEASDGELAAFISYAAAFPDGFLALVDTYDVIRSGVPNFAAVSLALDSVGYRAVGIRLDSGDLSYLSIEVRKIFRSLAEHFKAPWFADMTIVASNDINEDTIHSLNQQGHSINTFGIGTHLVTCQKQPALGCVYKLVEIENEPRMKLSEDVEKVTIPGKKAVYRLYGADGNALVDLLQRPDEPVPQPGKRVLCRHPFQESKRAYVSPAKVECLYRVWWKDGEICHPLPTLNELRNHALESLNTLRTDHKRALNPTPYKVSVSDKLYGFIHDLWLANAPIGELS